MGTNYYLHRRCPNACEHCALEAEPLHIGKNSWGWTFGFQAHPSLGITRRTDWEAAIADGGTIVNEYDEEVAPEDFWTLVEDSRKPRADGGDPLIRYGRETPLREFVYRDEGAYLDPDGWDFTMTEFF